MMDNSKLLRKEIDKRGLRHNFVANKLGISNTTLSKYLTGFSKVPNSVLALFCLTFGADPKIFGIDDTLSVHSQETA